MDGKTGLWVAVGIAAIAGGWFALSQKSAAAKAEKEAAEKAAKEAADAAKATKAETIIPAKKTGFGFDETTGYAVDLRQAISPISFGFLASHDKLKSLLAGIPTKKRFNEISAKYQSMFKTGILDDIQNSKGIPEWQYKMYYDIVAKKPR